MTPAPVKMKKLAQSAGLKKTKSKKIINRGSSKNTHFVPAWIASAGYPFTMAPAHVPDSNTSLSGLCTSTQIYRGSAVTSDGGTSTTHSFGFVLPPFPCYSTFSSNSGTGFLSDVDATGVNYLNIFNNSSAAPITPSNMSAVLGTTSAQEGRTKIRCTAIGVRITYEGTELQRSGKIVSALCPVDGLGTVFAATGTKISLLGAVAGQLTTDIYVPPTGIQNNATSWSERRVSNKPFTARWFPAGSPTYQTVASTPEYYSASAGIAPLVGPTIWNASPGGTGNQAGQNALVVGVIGDTTANASSSSNPYTIELKWHWEVIPDQPISVAYSLSPSPSDAGLMDSCLNAFQNMSVSDESGNGSALS